MLPIPEDILKQFNAVLDGKAVPSALRDDYLATTEVKAYLTYLAVINVPAGAERTSAVSSE